MMTTSDIARDLAGAKYFDRSGIKQGGCKSDIAVAHIHDNCINGPQLVCDILPDFKIGINFPLADITATSGWEGKAVGGAFFDGQGTSPYVTVIQFDNYDDMIKGIKALLIIWYEGL